MPKWSCIMWKQILVGSTGGIIAAVIGALIIYAFPTLWDEITRPSMPSGAVVAFSSKDCPTDGRWEKFVPAQGRFILGYDGGSDAGKQPGKLGGSSTVTLNENNIPPHSHSIPDHFLSAFNTDRRINPSVGGAGHGIIGGRVYKTGSVGSASPFRVIPPFVILTFCRKR